MARSMYMKDAKKGLTATVSPRQARLGKKSDKGQCPTALCILEIPGVIAAQVGVTKTCITLENGVRYRFSNSKELENRIRIFDKTGKFKPGQIQFLPIAKSQTMEAIRARMQKRRKEGYALANKPYQETGSRTPRKMNLRFKKSFQAATKLEKRLFNGR